MEPDVMRVRLHLRRIRVLGVVADLIERLVVEIADVRRVVRCPYCGFQTPGSITPVVFRLRDLSTQGPPSEMKWVRRRFECGEGEERRWEDHPEIIIGRRTHTGETLGNVAYRDAAALSGFLPAHGHRWLRSVRLVVSDGSVPYRAAIRTHLGHATHALDRFHVARWFDAGMIEVRRRIQRIGNHRDRPVFEPEIFRSRYLQLTRFDQLEDHRIESLGRSCPGRAELETAWRMTQQPYGIHLAADAEEPQPSPIY